MIRRRLDLSACDKVGFPVRFFLAMIRDLRRILAEIKMIKCDRDIPFDRIQSFELNCKNDDRSTLAQCFKPMSKGIIEEQGVPHPLTQMTFDLSRDRGPDADSKSSFYV